MGNTVNDDNVLGSANFEPEVNRRKSPVKVFAASFVLLCAAAFLFAQESGISAGGRWMEYDSQDQMTLVKTARFELPADNSLSGSDSSPKVILFCTAGKMKLLADLFPSPGFLRENMAIFLATRLKKGQATPEPDERITQKVVTLREAERWIRSGKIRDGKTVAGILYYAKYIAKKR